MHRAFSDTMKTGFILSYEVEKKVLKLLSIVSLFATIIKLVPDLLEHTIPE